LTTEEKLAIPEKDWEHAYHVVVGYARNFLKRYKKKTGIDFTDMAEDAAGQAVSEFISRNDKYTDRSKLSTYIIAFHLNWILLNQYRDRKLFAEVLDVCKRYAG